MRPIPDDMAAKVMAAAPLFAERGLDGATMSDIAEVTSIPRATLYYYFEGKEAVFACMCGLVLDRFEEVISAALGEPGPAAERLGGVVRAQLGFCAAHPAAFLAMHLDLGRAARRAEMSQRILRSYLRPVAALLEEGAADGRQAGRGFPDICAGRLVGGMEKNSSTRRRLMMKAIRARQGTGVSGLVLEEVPDPHPNFCEVLVKVAAGGITHNELDWPIWTCRAGHQRTTVIPGHEVSGVVTALGFGTAGLAVGDEVFGLTDQLRDGAAAEYVAVEARNLALKPRTVDHVHAAAVPRAGLTAWQGLFDHGKLAKGQTVVIHGAGGAVGSTAVQLARWAGAEVIGTGRGHSRQLVMELGADRYIALDSDRLEDVAGQADLVFDTIGGEVIARSPALLKPGGTLVTIRADAQLPAGRDDISTVVFIQESSRAQLADLARLVDEGHLRPQVGAVYPLAQAVEAYSAKAAGGIPGRTVLQP